jgi:tRNA (Thr-GGU) A37 N-methylase
VAVLPKATPERLSTFSDGVFAVLITVLVLELRPPEHPTFEALLSLWHTWLSYAVSTPVLDVKPYIPMFDRIERPRVPPWVDAIMDGYF